MSLIMIKKRTLLLAAINSTILLQVKLGKWHFNVFVCNDANSSKLPLHSTQEDIFITWGVKRASNLPTQRQPAPSALGEQNVANH